MKHFGGCNVSAEQSGRLQVKISPICKPGFDSEYSHRAANRCALHLPFDVLYHLLLSFLVSLYWWKMGRHKTSYDTRHRSFWQAGGSGATQPSSPDEELQL